MNMEYTTRKSLIYKTKVEYGDYTINHIEGCSHGCKSNIYGITFVSLDENFRKTMDPYSAPCHERIASLKNLSCYGFKTWVSIEPYPTPNIITQDILKFLEEINFVDKIFFGRINYSKTASKYGNEKIFFNRVAKEVILFFKSNNIEYHIKKGTITKNTKT